MLWLPIVLIAAVWLWPVVWFRLVGQRISVEVQLLRHQARIGEVVPVSVILRNRAWLPCPHVEVVLELPTGLSGTPDGKESVLRWSTHLLMRQELQVTLACYAVRRGFHQLGHKDALLRVDEGFGLREKFLRWPIQDEVTVLPSIASIPALETPVQALSGKLEVTRWLHPDETLLRGIRAYQYGDPYRTIAWAASARTGSWMAKQFSSSTEVTAVLLVSAQFYKDHFAGTHSREFDILCSVASAVARALAAKHIGCVLATNATNPRAPMTRWYGAQRAIGVEALLGRVYPYSNGDFLSVLAGAFQFATHSQPMMVCAGYFSPEQLRALRDLALRGHRVTVFWTGEPNVLSAIRKYGVDVIPVSSHGGEECHHAQ